VDWFTELGCPGVTLPLKGFNFVTKIVEFDLFIAMINFGHCCVIAIFKLLYLLGKKKHICPPLGIVLGRWKNFITQGKHLKERLQETTFVGKKKKKKKKRKLVWSLYLD
jgi:hypothetical protein